MDEVPHVPWGHIFDETIHYSRDGCKIAFPASRNTIRSFDYYARDGQLHFRCWDEAEVLGMNEDGTLRQQSSPLHFSLWCDDEWRVETFPYNRWDTHADEDEVACVPPDDEDEESEVDEIRHDEEIETVKTGNYQTADSKETCSDTIVIDIAVAEINRKRKYGDRTAALQDFRLIGWVTEFQEKWFHSLQTISFREHGNRFHRNPQHHDESFMHFDDLKAGHSYEFCGQKSWFESVELHQVLAWKVPRFKRNVSVERDAWYYLDAKGVVKKVPDALSPARRTEET